jgi:hypothetical protein
MDVDPFTIRYQRKQKKRQDFKLVLSALVEGLASLVDGQRGFAEEFGLSYERVFHNDQESFKGRDSRKVIGEWLRSGEEGASKMRDLFDDLARHQVAVVEAIDQVSKESADLGKLKKSKLANKLGYDPRADSVVSKTCKGLNEDAHQRLMLSAFVAGYARAREQMRADREDGPEERHPGKAIMNQHQG